MGVQSLYLSVCEHSVTAKLETPHLEEQFGGRESLRGLRLTTPLMILIFNPRGAFYTHFSALPGAAMHGKLSSLLWGCSGAGGGGGVRWGGPERAWMEREHSGSTLCASLNTKHKPKQHSVGISSASLDQSASVTFSPGSGDELIFLFFYKLDRNDAEDIKRVEET